MEYKNPITVIHKSNQYDLHISLRWKRLNGYSLIISLYLNYVMVLEDSEFAAQIKWTSCMLVHYVFWKPVLSVFWLTLLKTCEITKINYVELKN